MRQAQPLTIQTHGLRIRPVLPGDFQVAYMLSQEEGIRVWLPDQVYTDEAESRSVLNYLSAQCVSPANPRLSPYVLGICLRATEQIIGHVGFSPYRGGVEIGFAIGTTHQGHGFAKQAVAAASAWALTAFALPMVLGVAAQDNVKSCRVLESCGFVLQTVQLQTLQGIERMVRTYQFPASGSPNAA